MVRKSLELLRKVPIFRTLRDSDLERIVQSPHNAVVEFRPGDTVMEENEVGDCMYIVLEGAVDVRIKAVDGREITISTLTDGDFFGEQALLPGATGKRNASVRVLRWTRLFRISKHDVLLGMQQAADEALPELGDPDLVTEEQRVKMLLRSNRLFRSVTDAELARLPSWVEVVEYGPGEMILREKERGDSMYIVLEGTVEVFVVDDQGKFHILAELTRGHYFGEQALLPHGGGTHNANVRSKFAVKLVKVAREFLQLMLNKDKKLALALQVVGDSQRKKINELKNQDTEW